ncbi:MAG: N-acetylglucosamine-6-phosphate deacetylase [Flavihumibacter sp.]|nr:N-acetylglucosamine-6-phosphate deacetylase [Flavihumibacter sp.]
MSNKPTAFYNGAVFTGTEIVNGKAVLTNNGVIEAVVDEAAIPANYEHINLQQQLLAPAFIDLQIYGGNGFLFSQALSIEALQAVYEYCRAGGATNFLITIATNTDAVFFKSLEVAHQYLQQGGKGLAGVHLEGPYINPDKRGAHLLDCIKQPTSSEVAAFLQAGNGIIKMMTLAPEQCDIAVVKQLQDAGVVVSAGHSNASYEQATKSFDQITTCTHLFNAMSPLQHRAPGMVGAIYNHATVCSSVVPDGIHVDFAALRISKKIMQQRLFIITDAVAAVNEGGYQHVFQHDRYVLPNGTLSGSALTMLKGVQNCVLHAGIALEEALRMASLYPARVMGWQQLGKIEKGCKAQLVVLNNSLELTAVYD